MAEDRDLPSSVARLAGFLAEAPLTDTIADLEVCLDGTEASVIDALSRAHGIDIELLRAAVVVRRDLGRLSDLIHAAAMLLVLPEVLTEGEHIAQRPSLGAGNDPTRPYDLETNLRVAEFKLSSWKGADAMRKRHVFKDLVHLAADSSGRQPELFIVGDAPARFLRRSKSSASWALDRFPVTRTLFLERFGPLDMPVATFTAGAGARVRITDIAHLLPSVGLMPDY